MLRKMYGPVIEQGMWGIRIKQKLWELYNDLDVEADIHMFVCVLCMEYKQL